METVAGKRIKPRLVKGFRDVFGGSISARQGMIGKITAVYESYGFQPLETPALEYADVIGKYLPEADTPEGGVFAFRDENEEWTALRYDLTAPLSRVVAGYADLPTPFRRYQVGPVFRLEKPGPGRFREFYQCDFDTVGAPKPASDAESCMILADTMEALGIKRGDYIIRLSNRKLLDALLREAGIDISGKVGESRRLTVLRALDKLDRIGLDGVRELLGKGRKDQSGDFTIGAELEPGQTDMVMRFLKLPSGNRNGTLENLADIVGKNETGRQAIDELRVIHELLAGLGYDEECVILDPTVVRGLAYYTGPVFEVELTFEVDGDTGVRRKFGSVAGGGRYDGLVERFLGRRVPATGASIGVDRLLAALEHLGLASGADRSPVLVAVMDKKRMEDYFKLAGEIRAAGIPSEVYMGNPRRMGAQFKYADRRGMPAVVICGEDEFSAGTVSIKDLEAGRVAAKEVADRETWRKERPAQVTVPRDKLIGTLRKILGT